jgi:uncharacterized membrane protein HdeD (DUF308 family)
MLLLILGIILVLISLVVAKLAVLWIIGVILIIGGVVMLVLSATGRRTGRWYW